MKSRVIPWGEVTIKELIGQGSFGQVHVCTHNSSVLAVKQLPPEASGGEQLDELLAEFEVMLQLRHPNLLLLVGIASDLGSRAGIVMELMPASLLDVLHAPDGRYPEGARSWAGCLLAVATDVSRGMAHLHGSGMLHRDLKPGNVLLSKHWVAKVADFGSAHSSARGGGAAPVGTPPYMAPEVVKRAHVDRPSDVWSFGALMAHMGSRQLPFSQLGQLQPLELMRVVAEGSSTPVDLLDDSNCPGKLLDLARHCVAPSPAGRPSFEEVTDLLASLVAVVLGRDAAEDEEAPRPMVALLRKRGGEEASSVAKRSASLKFRAVGSLNSPRGPPSPGDAALPRSPPAYLPTEDDPAAERGAPQIVPTPEWPQKYV